MISQSIKLIVSYCAKIINTWSSNSNCVLEIYFNFCTSLRKANHLDSPRANANERLENTCKIFGSDQLVQLWLFQLCFLYYTVVVIHRPTHTFLPGSSSLIKVMQPYCVNLPSLLTFEPFPEKSARGRGGKFYKLALKWVTGKGRGDSINES